jgi:hypothetical protein
LRRVRAGVEGPVAERLDLGVEFLRHDTDLGLRERGDAQRVDEFLHPSGRDTEQIAGRHHRGQGAFRSLTPFE